MSFQDEVSQETIENISKYVNYKKYVEVGYIALIMQTQYGIKDVKLGNSPWKFLLSIFVRVLLIVLLSPFVLVRAVLELIYNSVLTVLNVLVFVLFFFYMIIYSLLNCMGCCGNYEEDYNLD